MMKSMLKYTSEEMFRFYWKQKKKFVLWMFVKYSYVESTKKKKIIFQIL